MAKVRKEKSKRMTPLEKYSDEITPAYHRAVREALIKHKREGVPAVIQHDGMIVFLQPDDIEVE
jgi:hypothetical protein